MPGRDSGHHDPTPPPGLRWIDLLEPLIGVHGGWTAFAHELVRRTAGAAGAPRDPLTVEKGLRRLSRRDHRAGGQYGRWVLRAFGVPRAIEDWARWLAQYHYSCE